MKDEDAIRAAWAAGFRAGRDAAVARVDAVGDRREAKLGGRRAGMVTTAIRNLAPMLRELEPPGDPVPDLRLLEVKPEWRSGRGRWWRDNGAGYTDLPEQAGLYAPDDDRVREYQDHDPDLRSVARTRAEVLAEVNEPAVELLRRARSR